MLRIPLRSTIPKQTTPTHKAQHLTPTTQLTTTLITLNSSPRARTTTPVGHRCGVADVWCQFQVFRFSIRSRGLTGGTTCIYAHVLQSSLRKPAAGYLRKHAAKDMPEINSEGTAGRQPRRTDRKPAERNRPGISRESPAGYRLSGTCR